MTTLIRTKLAILGLLAATAITGCGTGDPFARNRDVAEHLADIVCTCPGWFGQPSEAVCLDVVAGYAPTETEEACVRRAYDAHAAELDPVLDCFYAAGVAQIDCLEPLLLTCPPPPAANDCLSDYRRALEACPSPSTQAQAEVAACGASRS